MITFYKRGPNAASFEAEPAEPSEPGGRGVAPLRTGLLVDPHRGTVKLPVQALPDDPARLPGLTNKNTPSGARCWWFKVPDGEGNVWSIQLNAKKDGQTGTILATPPTVRTRDLQAALDLDGPRLAAQKLLLAWGEPFGLLLPRTRLAAVQVQPKEWSMPGMGLRAGLKSNDGRTFTDPSQGKGSLETQDAAVVQAVANSPETEAKVSRLEMTVAALERQAEVGMQYSTRIAAASEKTATNLGLTQEAVVVALRAVAGAQEPRGPAMPANNSEVAYA
jgi:hypothetical protein